VREQPPLVVSRALGSGSKYLRTIVSRALAVSAQSLAAREIAVLATKDLARDARR
jgi:hypothetical protein